MSALNLTGAHKPLPRVRGKKRYFAAVRAKAEALEFRLDDEMWWDCWHYHADWPGLGNVRWKNRREHLKALCVVYRKIAARLPALGKPFQSWILLSGDDAGQDATYLHTPNPNEQSFPIKIDPVEWGQPGIERIFAELMPEYEMRVGKHPWTDPEEGPRVSYIAYCSEVGVGLQP